MRNPKISRVFVSSIAGDEKGFPLCCWALDWATDHISYKRLLNHENSGKGFRIPSTETCDLYRCRDHFSLNIGEIKQQLSENLSPVPERNSSNLRSQDTQRICEHPFEGLLHRGNIVLRTRQIIDHDIFSCLAIERLHLGDNQWGQTHGFSVCFVFIQVFGAYSENWARYSWLNLSFWLNPSLLRPHFLLRHFPVLSKHQPSWFVVRWLESDQYWSRRSSSSYADAFAGNGIR